MKKNVVIVLKNVLQKVVAILLCGVLLTGAFRIQVHKVLLNRMKEKILSQSGSEPLSWDRLFAFHSSRTVFAAMPTLPKEPAAAPSPLPAFAKEEAAKAPALDAADLSQPQSENSVTDHGIIVKNHAGKSFQISDLLTSPLPYDKTTGGYKVLLVHSHTTESYYPKDRSESSEENMIAVGKRFAAILESQGIKTLHITKVHDVPYTTSYKKSLESVTAALAEHPSIQVVIDLHRDAIYNEANEKIKPLATIDGISAAQVMLVTGTEKGGLPHPDWESNLAFCLKVQNEMLKTYPGLARPVDLRKERFNTHTTKNSIIFEIGSNGNTLEEAIRGAEFAARAVAAVLNRGQ